MKKLILALMFILALVSIAFAQSRVYILLNGVTSTGDGTGQSLAPGATGPANSHNCQVTFAGTKPTTATVNLKGSIDGTSYYEMVSGNHTITPYGEMIANGTFTGASTYWVLDGSAAYGTNSIDVSTNTVSTATVSEASSTMTIAPIIGERYLLTYTISGSGTTGSVTPTLAGATATTRTANGTYQENLTATSIAGISFSFPASTKMTLDDVIVYRNEDQGFIALNRPAFYVKGTYVSKTGGSTDTAVTMKCTSEGK